MKTEKTSSDILRRIAKLEDAVFGKGKAISSTHHAKQKSSESLDFSMGIRGFVKRHAKGMSGPKKFTLLLAYLAKGDLNKTILFVEIKKHWNNLTAKSLLGMEYNSFFASSAKESDWVKTEKSGSYTLRPSWKAIFA